MKKHITPKNDYLNSKNRLENALRDFCRILLRERMKEKGLPIATETLDETSENYGSELMWTVEICIHNLIETDIDNLRDIFGSLKDY